MQQQTGASYSRGSTLIWKLHSDYNVINGLDWSHSEVVFSRFLSG